MPELDNAEQILVCPVKRMAAVVADGSLVGTPREAGPYPETLCDPGCTGPTEVPRASLSPLRILSAMKTVCSLDY
ncbi:hypothetical protein EKI60_05485 [Candidatus Saccharibacteria bacterium]|nr:MAG: hypothetical protein EKI60_05485 [Candidatus Saccharibacteria bacterium]